MKIKCLPLLAAFLTVSFIVTSCLNSDETEATYSFNSSITAFSLGTLHIDRMGIDSNGEDSAYVDTINCAKYPFSIDQTTRVIENKDSLPVGTHIDKVVTDLTADSDVIFYTKNGKDTLWTSTDSIDFTMNDPETGVQEHAVMFGVYAYSGTRGKTYKVKVNVHLQEPDTITWKNFNSPAFPTPLAEMKAVYAGGKVFVFGKDGTETVIRYMEVSSGEPQAWQDVEVTGLSSIQAASATVWRDEVYFLANGKEKGENPYYEHLYRVNLDGSGLRQLSPGDYFHQVQMDDDARFFVCNYSRVNTIPATDLYDRNGNKVMELERSDFSQLLAAGYRFPEPFKVKAADGVTDLYGVMYKPFNFDSTKVYPIIDYVYPGPQVEATVYPFTRMSVRTDRLAQAGFIVITVGNRGGHPSRSKWYHNFGYGNLRDYGLADQKAAIEQLANRYSFIDIHRVGIHGHSGGGFMSTAAILQYPDFFKVAVSCAGNHDNRIYNRWWSTTFVYSIKTNPEIARQLKGHLMLVHGDIDNNVHPGNTLRVVDALIRANKRFDLLILPQQRHGFGDMDEYFYWRMVDYFSLHLLGKQDTAVDIPRR